MADEMYQALMNANMQAFAAHYEVPTFYDPALFDGWRIADVNSVGKLFWKRDPLLRAIGNLTLWYRNLPLHDLPESAPYTLDREVMARVKAALLSRSNRATLYVDARHVQALAIHCRHAPILRLIASDSPNLQWLAGVYTSRTEREDWGRSDDL